MIISALGFALMGFFVKIASAKGFPILELIFARAVVSLLLCFADVHRLKIHPWGKKTSLLWLRGIVGFLSLIAVYASLTTLPLAEATLLQYLHPIFTAFLAFLFLGEYIQRNTIISILLGFMGICILLKPTAFGGTSLPLVGISIGLLGAAGSGCAYTLVRHLSHTEHPSVIVLYFPLVCLPLSLAFGWKSFIMPHGIDWFLLIAIGVFTQIGQVALTVGMSLAKAAKAAAYSYVQVVFALILGVLFLGESFSISTLLSAVFIIAGAMMNQSSLTNKKAQL